MLVISRKNSESIHIGDDVVVTVLRTRRGGVQIGIEAPRDVAIRRAELTAGDEGKPAGLAMLETDPERLELLRNDERITSAAVLSQTLLKLARQHSELVVRELRPGQLWFAGTIS